MLVDANLRLITSPISLETEDLLKIGTAKLSPQLKTSVAHDEYPRLASLDLAVSVSRSFAQIQSTIITYLYNLRNNSLDPTEIAMIDLYLQVYGDQLQQTIGSVMAGFIPSLLLVPVAYLLSSATLSAAFFYP